MLLPLLNHLAILAQDTPAGPADGAAAPGGLMDLLPPMLLIIGIFYFVLIRPERKKQKTRAEMLAAMKKGDKVMTSAGIYGSIAQAQEDIVTLQVADGVRMRFNRAAIQTILTDGKTGDEKPTDLATVQNN